jgi:hypothetical protein
MSDEMNPLGISDIIGMTQADAADRIAALTAERDALALQVQRARDALTHYRNTLCEGFCEGDKWSDAGHCNPYFQENCGGCMAASVLLRGATEGTGG